MKNSSILDIASITAVIKRLLGNELVQQLAATPMSDIAITSLPPDRIPTGGDERAQINIYLYQVSPSTGRYTTEHPRTEPAQADYASLALQLHYLFSVYGESDLQTEVLLACVIRFFHKNPVLTQEILQSTLISLATEHHNTGMHSLFHTADIGAQKERWQPVKIVPEFLSLENMSKLWSSLQAHARPSVTYEVSTVFLDGYL